MRRDTLYSSRPQPRAVLRETVRPAGKGHEKAMLLAAGALIGLCAVTLNSLLQPAPPPPPPVAEAKPLPPPAVAGYRAVRGSIVRVRAVGEGLEDDQHLPRSVGSGVVIVDKGVILTNLHVVKGASRIFVTFFNGLESEATLVTTRPESDLAVVQARDIPDDLRAATLRSTKDLEEGEPVTAVGFPFGIGPSVSAGVVSGTGREYRARDGERSLSNLIQFDAAANPGSSGGPLLNASGEVIGIVTAILSASGTYSGIAFAVPIETAAAAAGLPPF